MLQIRGSAKRGAQFVKAVLNSYDKRKVCEQILLPGEEASRGSVGPKVVRPPFHNTFPKGTLSTTSFFSADQAVGAIANSIVSGLFRTPARGWSISHIADLACTVEE